MKIKCKICKKKTREFHISEVNAIKELTGKIPKYICGECYSKLHPTED